MQLPGQESLPRMAWEPTCLEVQVSGTLPAALEAKKHRCAMYAPCLPCHPCRLKDLVLKWMPVSHNKAIDGEAPEQGGCAWELRAARRAGAAAPHTFHLRLSPSSPARPGPATRCAAPRCTAATP